MSEEIKNEDVTSTEPAVESAPVVEEKVEELTEVAPATVEEKLEAVKPAKAVEEPAIAEPVAEVKQAVVTNAKPSSAKAPAGKPGLTPVENGAIGSGVVQPKPVAKKATPKVEPTDTVAIRSTRNVVWQGVGKVNRGVNIVSKAEADQWLTRNHVTVLTPEEVAKEYGN